MTVLIREKPPLRLSAEIVEPDGHDRRLGDTLGHSGPSTALNSLQFSTVAPGGFETASFDLMRDPRFYFGDDSELSTVRIRGPGGFQIAWEGRIESLPVTSGDNAAFSPQMAGWQNHLDDDSSACAIFIDQDLSNWTQPSVNEQIYLDTNSISEEDWQVAPDKGGQPRLGLTIGQNAPYTGSQTPSSDAWYDAGAAKVNYYWFHSQFTPAAQNAAFSLRLALYSGDNENATGAVGAELYAGTGTTASPDQSGYEMEGNTPRRWGLVRWRYTATGWSPGGVRAARVRLAVYGDHKIPRQSGADPQGFLASDCIKYALNQWCPLLDYTTGATGSIQDSDFVIPQAVYLEPSTVTPMIQDLSRFELLDWFVWEGPRFYLAQRPTLSTDWVDVQPGQKTKLWRAYAGPAALQEAGQQIARVYNGVLVSYTDVDGRTRTVGPPGSGMPVTDLALEDDDPQNPANEVAGLNRWAMLQMQGTSTASGAIAVGARFLAEYRTLDRSGEATLVGHAQDSSGIWWPAWRVRAGDYISFRDAADISYRRIVHTDYDDSSKTCSLQLDQPPDALAALLQRLSVALVSLGLT